MLAENNQHAAKIACHLKLICIYEIVTKMFTRHGAYDRVNIMNNGLKCSLNIFAQCLTPNYGSVLVLICVVIC